MCILGVGGGCACGVRYSVGGHSVGLWRERERERESTNTSRPFRVLVLSEGEVVESGRPWELLSNKESHFHSIFQSQ